MTIVSKVTRFFLLLGAVSIGATGFKYIQGSRNGTLSTGPLSTVFEPEIFKGYGLEALAPFAGMAYLTCAATCGAAALLFDGKPAAIVLLLFGLIFNVGMAVIRVKFVNPEFYKGIAGERGAAANAGIVQGTLGTMCTLSALATLIVDDGKAKAKAA